MSKKIQRLYTFLSWSWLLIILAFAIYDINSLFTQQKIQFNLMVLLPKNKSEEMKIANQFIENSKFMDRSLILIGHSDAGLAQSAFEKFRHDLEHLSLPLKEQRISILAEKYKAFFKNLYPHRAGFLSASDRKHLLMGKGDVLVQRALSNLMLPFNVLGPFQPKHDPFFLYPHFIASLKSPFSIENGKEEAVIRGDEKTWYLFNAQMTEPTFSLKTQQEMIEKLLPYLDQLKQTHGVEILKTGAVFYAAAGAAQANQEISQIGLIAILGIIITLFLVFRTLQPLVFALFVVGSSLIGGLAICLFIFKSVHILALVFGSSLVGVTVDYALHYFCARYQHDGSSPQSHFHVLKRLMPALPLGVFSSILGYSLLIVVPFPGIQQMAVLASGGLLCSFLTVCFCAHFFVSSTQKKIPSCGAKLQKYLDKVADFGRRKKGKIILSVLSLFLFFAGACVLTFEDDVRQFQSLDRVLKKEEEKIQAMMKVDHGSRFLTIVASTVDDVLQREEQLAIDLEKKGISNYRGLATLIPSTKRQQENRQLIKKALYEKHGSSFAHILGPEFLMDMDNLGLKAPFFDVPRDLPDGWRELIYFPSEGRVIGQMLLHGTPPLQELQELASRYEGVSYIDLPYEYSSLFSSYRQIMMGLVLAVLFGIMIGFAIWKGVKESLQIVAPVVLSILATVGIISLSGISFNLFHVMGLLLVLCIGIDYAFFLYFRKPSENLGHTGDFLLLANGLAALTTLFSFGLLVFSKTIAIHSFGLTVFIGIVLCFCLTAVFFGKGQCDNE
jgi:predicted exporter